MVKPPPLPTAAYASQLTPSIKKFAIKRAEVTGASWSPSIRERPLLTAAREKRMLAPHSWQRGALISTSAPQAGGAFGPGAGSPPAKTRDLILSPPPPPPPPQG